MTIFYSIWIMRTIPVFSHLKSQNSLPWSLEVVAACASLTTNCRKTKTLSLTRNAKGLVQVGGEQMEAIDKYLGSETVASGGTDLDIESQIKKAISAFGTLSSVWGNANLSTGLKLSTIIWLFHLEGYKKILRKILHIYWPNIFNTALLQTANPLDVHMRRQKWWWIGHTLRKDEKCIVRKATKRNLLISARRLPGRPRKTWRRTVARES